MTAPVALSPIPAPPFDPQPKDLIDGLFAALGARDVSQVRAADLHERFGDIVAALALEGPRLCLLSLQCHQDITSHEWDVVDDGIHDALFFGLAEWTGHDYRTLQLRISRRVAHRLLTAWGDDRAALERAADVYLRWQRSNNQRFAREG